MCEFLLYNSLLTKFCMYDASCLSNMNFVNKADTQTCKADTKQCNYSTTQYKLKTVVKFGYAL